MSKLKEKEELRDYLDTDDAEMEREWVKAFLEELEVAIRRKRPDIIRLILGAPLSFN
jgi:hypothetical protein